MIKGINHQGTSVNTQRQYIRLCAKRALGEASAFPHPKQASFLTSTIPVLLSKDIKAPILKMRWIEVTVHGLIAKVGVTSEKNESRRSKLGSKSKRHTRSTILTAVVFFKITGWVARKYRIEIET